VILTMMPAFVTTRRDDHRGRGPTRRNPGRRSCSRGILDARASRETSSPLAGPYQRTRR